MKIDIINDNEINIVFMISDKSPEYNLPKLNGNDLLIESKGSLRKLTNNDLDKIFLNNKENLKIYLFPLNVNSNFLKNDKLYKCYELLETFINNNEIVDIGYIKSNQLDYIFSINEYSKSFKHYLNETFEELERKITINKNILKQKYNNLMNYLNENFLNKDEVLKDINFPQPDKFEQINISSDIHIPDKIDKYIDFDELTNLNNTSILFNLNKLNERYETLKNKIENLRNNKETSGNL